MGKADYPITTAVRMLREKKIAFIPHLYPFVEHGGTRHTVEIHPTEIEKAFPVIKVHVATRP
jgi:hypothetical protein